MFLQSWMTAEMYKNGLQESFSHHKEIFHGLQEQEVFQKYVNDEEVQHK